MPHAHIALPCAQDGAQLNRGVEASGDGDGANQRAGRAFAVDTRNRHRGRLAHQVAEQRLPLGDRDALRGGRL